MGAEVCGVLDFLKSRSSVQWTQDETLAIIVSAIQKQYVGVLIPFVSLLCCMVSRMKNIRSEHYTLIANFVKVV